MARYAALRWLSAMLILPAACFIGCQESTPPQPNQSSPPAANGNGSGTDGAEERGSINIQAPGVDVEVDPQGGVSVDAPAGVNVDVDNEDGVSVDAPGTDVDVNEETP